MGRRDAHISPAHAAWAAAKDRVSQPTSTRSQQPETSINRNVRSRSGQTREHHGIPLLDLPPELLHFIFDYLDKPTIYNARTTCKVLAKVGADYILDSIHVVYKRDNLKELLEIAEKPNMAKFIHSFWLQADRFGPAMTFPEWDLEREDLKPWSEYNIYHELPLDHDYETSAGRRAFESARKRFAKRKKGKHSKAAISNAYEQYKATIADQDSIVDERLDHQCFYELFAACLNLTDVTVSIGHGTSGYIDKGRKAYKNIMMHPYGDIDYHDQGVHQFWTVVEALHHAKRQPLRFFLGDVSYRVLRSTWRDAPVDPWVENLMQNLRELRIGFSVYDDEPVAGVPHDVLALRTESDELYRKGLLAKWLGSAPNLRVLKVRMWHTEFRAPYARMEDVLGTTGWPKLRELGLSEFTTTEDYLVNLLLRHKDSLRRLSLSDIHLSSGAWDFFLDRVGGKLPKLRKVKLRNHFRDAFDTEMEFADEGTGINGGRDATEYQLLHGGEVLDFWLENDGLFPEDLDNYEPPSRVDESDAGYTTNGSEVSYGSDDFDDTI